MTDRKSREWTVPCLDAVGRDAELRLFPTKDGRYGLTMPAGESATVDLDGLAELIRAARCVAGLGQWHERQRP